MESGEGPDKKKKKTHPMVMVAGSAEGSEAGGLIIGNLVVGLLIGYGIEWVWPQSKPWGMVAGLLLGIVSGFYQVFKREAQITRRWKERRAAQKKKQLEEDTKK